MPVIDNCTVQLAGGDSLDEVSVLFKDNGWIRVTYDDHYIYFPPDEVTEVVRPIGGGD